MNWKSKRVLVTGGASFIGSHLVDLLVSKEPAHLRVVDDLSSGKVSNIQAHIDAEQVEFVQSDLLAPNVAEQATENIDVVFHLAAIHGGRGFLESHHALCSRNVVMDGTLIGAALKQNVERFIFASSGCVYPTKLQADVTQEVYLREDMVGPPYDPDGMYGWAKLTTELMLASHHKDYGLQGVSCRFFTVYGERALESHAIMAMIGRAFLKQSPFEVWGDGEQIRNWTYVGDIVRGFVLAAESIIDGSAINLGTRERIRVIDAAEQILAYTGHEAEIKLLPHMPTGPVNRAADPSRAEELLGWKRETPFAEGLERTIDWYFATRDRAELDRSFETLLVER